MKFFLPIALLFLVSLACPAAEPFAARLFGDGFSVRLSSPNKEDSNTLTLAPTGLRADNSPVTREVDGLVTRAALNDIDGDGSPELLVWLLRPDGGFYGSVVVYSTNRRKSLSEIWIAPPEPGDFAGYRGEDEFEVVQHTFVRRFPVYKEGDKKDSPTGGIRQFQYKLKKSESGWQLKLDRVVNY
jgi:hypothetical protein